MKRHALTVIVDVHHTSFDVSAFYILSGLIRKWVAAISCSAMSYRLGRVGFGFWLTGKLGCAWIGAWFGAWDGAALDGEGGEVVGVVYLQ